MKATLFALVAANLLLALFGLGLAVVAYSTLVSERGVRDLQARLGTAGMVAQIFEGYRDKEVTSLEDLFGKRTIGSSRKGGKWSFSGLSEACSESNILLGRLFWYLVLYESAIFESQSRVPLTATAASSSALQDVNTRSRC